MSDASETIRGAVARGFGGRPILVVGDLMLDVYLRGEVGRISPEAPVPVVRLAHRGEAPGGAGNVALNLAALGLRVAAAGLVGEDDAGRRLVGVMEGAGIAACAVAPGDGRPTTTKTRVLGGHQQMLRIDEEVAVPPPEVDQGRLLETALPLVENWAEALVLSDYDKGALTGRVCRTLISAARGRGIPVLVDPKGRDYAKYEGATALTPNRQDLEVAAGAGPLDGLALRDAATRLRERLGLDFLVVTLGEHGACLVDEGGLAEFPAVARAVYDVSGAGDTLLAALAAGLASGLGRDEALRLGILAAGLAVGKVGTAPVGSDELLVALPAGPIGSPPKLFEIDDLGRRLAEWRARGEQVVFTNGCFDLLHAGHVTLLERAREEGDRLVVGLNSDRSVRALKGPSRPAVPEGDRARVLGALAAVDAVVLFDEETPRRLVEVLRPDVLVKGADYAGVEIVGADLVRSWGGRVVLVPLVEGRSTTRLLARGS